MILTTEKDGVRLKKFKKELSDYPLYVLPITPYFLFGEGDSFDCIIYNFVSGFKKS